MEPALTLVLPFASVLLGAWITYVFNVRQRRRTKVEDILHEAMGAVALAQSSSTYITDLPPLPGVTSEEHAAFLRDIHREGHLSFVRAVAAARAAVARASAFDPQLGDNLDAANPFEAHGDAIIARLRLNIEQREGQRLRRFLHS